MTPGPVRSLMSPARPQRGCQAKELQEKGQQVAPAGGMHFMQNVTRWCRIQRLHHFLGAGWWQEGPAPAPSMRRNA